MQPFAVLTTMADPRRPGVTFKVEFESEEKFTEWLDFKFFLEERNRLWMEESEEGLNTSVTVFHADGRLEQRRLRADWTQVVTLLEVADDISRDGYEANPGRPPKRVLVSTTSKERRTSMPRAY